MAIDAMQIVPMLDAQLERAAAVMARAFFDDPLFVAGFPNPEERGRVVPWIAAWTFRFGMEFGEVVVREDLAGAAIVYRATEPVFTEERVAATEGDLRERLGPAAWSRYERMMHSWEAADAHLSQAVSEPHWYLDMVAVDPPRQGTGVGRALLQAVHALAEIDGWPTVLLTFRARNVPFYQRHGYVVVAQGVEPHAGLAYWGLRRAASA